MRRLLLSICLLLATASGAFAQQHNGQPCYTTNGTNCIPVGTQPSSGSAWGPLPVTGTISSGTITISSSTLSPVNSFTGNSAQVTSNPTIKASGYSAGNCIGGFNAVTVTDNNGQSGYITNVRFTSNGGTLYNIQFYAFDSQPSASTCIDKSTFTLSSTDLSKIIATGSVVFATPTGVTSPSLASLDFTPPRPFVAGGSSSSGLKTIYYGMQVTSAITPSSTNGIQLRFGVARNVDGN